MRSPDAVQREMLRRRSGVQHLEWVPALRSSARALHRVRDKSGYDGFAIAFERARSCPSPREAVGREGVTALRASSG